MQVSTQPKTLSAFATNKWCRRAGTAGFVFFLGKGLVWIVVAVWVVY